MGKISAIDIKKLWYANEIQYHLTPGWLNVLLNGGDVYEESTQGASGALEIVADSATPSSSQVKLSSVNACKGFTPAVGDYVKKTTVAAAATEVENIHQDTWQLEEGEASQDSYKNQLSGHVYRLGKRVMGDLTISFTVGQYDYKTKVDLMGGSMLGSDGAVTSVSASAVGWKRSDDVVEMYKTLIALTTDDVYITLSRASLGARESNTDKAIGMAMSGIMTDSKYSGVASEYWYDKSAIPVVG